MYIISWDPQISGQEYMNIMLTSTEANPFIEPGFTSVEGSIIFIHVFIYTYKPKGNK